MEPTDEILAQFYLWLSFLSFQSIEDFGRLEATNENSTAKPISTFFSSEMNSQGPE
jgi:hypothetical protein